MQDVSALSVSTQECKGCHDPTTRMLLCMLRADTVDRLDELFMRVHHIEIVTLTELACCLHCSGSQGMLC